MSVNGAWMENVPREMNAAVFCDVLVATDVLVNMTTGVIVVWNQWESPASKNIFTVEIKLSPGTWKRLEYHYLTASKVRVSDTLDAYPSFAT